MADSGHNDTASYGQAHGETACLGMKLTGTGKCTCGHNCAAYASAEGWCLLLAFCMEF